MAQKKYFLLFLIIANGITVLQGMEKNNESIDVMLFVDRLLAEKTIEPFPFFTREEAKRDLRSGLQSNKNFVVEYGSLKTTMSETQLFDLITKKQRYFMVKQSTPESTSPLKTESLGDKQSSGSRKNSLLLNKLSQSSEAIMITPKSSLEMQCAGLMVKRLEVEQSSVRPEGDDEETKDSTCLTSQALFVAFNNKHKDRSSKESTENSFGENSALSGSDDENVLFSWED